MGFCFNDRKLLIMLLDSIRQLNTNLINKIKVAISTFETNTGLKLNSVFTAVTISATNTKTYPTSIRTVRVNVLYEEIPTGLLITTDQINFEQETLKSTILTAINYLEINSGLKITGAYTVITNVAGIRTIEIKTEYESIF